mgnify:CR=1 FL=1
MLKDFDAKKPISSVDLKKEDHEDAFDKESLQLSAGQPLSAVFNHVLNHTSDSVEKPGS